MIGLRAEPIPLFFESSDSKNLDDYNDLTSIELSLIDDRIELMNDHVDELLDSYYFEFKTDQKMKIDIFLLA